MYLGLPEGLTFYRLFTDWGSLIGGLFALFAGGMAYVAGYVQAHATWQAAAGQIEAMTRRDRLQARGIVIGIYPELLEMQAAHAKAAKLLKNGLSPEATRLGQTFADAMRVRVPPLMERNVDHFFLIDPGGASLLQLVAISAQYNRLLGIISTNTDAFDYDDLEGHLKAIGLALGDALREVPPLHDEATQKPLT